MYRKEIDNLSHSAEVKIGLFNKSVPKKNVWLQLCAGSSVHVL